VRLCCELTLESMGPFQSIIYGRWMSVAESGQRRVPAPIALEPTNVPTSLERNAGPNLKDARALSSTTFRISIPPDNQVIENVLVGDKL
jgi:hypothetical protein